MCVCACVFWFVDYNDWGAGGVVVMMPKEQDVCVCMTVCACACVEGRVYIEMLQV